MLLVLNNVLSLCAVSQKWRYLHFMKKPVDKPRKVAREVNIDFTPILILQKVICGEGSVNNTGYFSNDMLLSMHV